MYGWNCLTCEELHKRILEKEVAHNAHETALILAHILWHLGIQKDK